MQPILLADDSKGSLVWRAFLSLQEHVGNL